MEMQVIHRNQVHMYPYPSQAVYSWSHPNFPAVIKNNRVKYIQMRNSQDKTNKQTKYANQNVSKYFLKLNIDSNSQTLYPKRANYHSLNCWLTRPVSYKEYLSSRSAFPHLLPKQLRVWATPLIVLHTEPSWPFPNSPCALKLLGTDSHTHLLELIQNPTGRTIRTQHSLYICWPLSNSGSVNSCSTIP